MYKILSLFKIFIAFFKIGAFSFGGGYAMLPFIEREIIKLKGWLTYKEFLDVLAISQASPGPIAINSATFIGYKYYYILGSIFATLGVISFSIICMNILSPALEKYKDNKHLSKILKFLKPITVGFILSSAYSTFNKSIFDLYSFMIFLLSFILLNSKKVHPIIIIIGFGLAGTILKGA
ncbi:chromate transporter [Tepidibacter thalassicus]|uniref:Chromate transporter n=1 Tax=Tepidibacter thalassicus DSM 15285 TaxID=1123350 RepID=A0A1M5RIS0_9FIRM|nr:chromate transporter [Tepidibacter thalassicus]SHH26161.1 chromate transporter [Tepidibacter thalassicus DSM 15285]